MVGHVVALAIVLVIDIALGYNTIEVSTDALGNRLLDTLQTQEYVPI